ncbi:MAG: hypothetical protein KC776_11860, partial [Myxococcales bacterium]|nr:hypothetical protein [Myxococcales bacterium]
GGSGKDAGAGGVLGDGGGANTGGTAATGNSGGTGNVGNSGGTGNVGGIGGTGNVGNSGGTGNVGGIGGTGNVGGIGGTGNVGGIGGTGNVGGIGGTGGTGATGGTGGSGGKGVVSCAGTDDCNLSGNFCCVYLSSTSFPQPVCQSTFAPCTPGTDVKCDGPEDCGNGQVCCGQLVNAPGLGTQYSELACRAENDCTFQQNRRIICGGSPASCPNNWSCVPSSVLKQYNYCSQTP